MAGECYAQVRKDGSDAPNWEDHFRVDIADHERFGEVVDTTTLPALESYISQHPDPIIYTNIRSVQDRFTTRERVQIGITLGVDARLELLELINHKLNSPCLTSVLLSEADECMRAAAPSNIRLREECVLSALLQYLWVDIVFADDMSYPFVFVEGGVEKETSTDSDIMEGGPILTQYEPHRKVQGVVDFVVESVQRSVAGTPRRYQKSKRQYVLVDDDDDDDNDIQHLLQESTMYCSVHLQQLESSYPELKAHFPSEWGVPPCAPAPYLGCLRPLPVPDMQVSYDAHCGTIMLHIQTRKLPISNSHGGRGFRFVIWLGRSELLRTHPCVIMSKQGRRTAIPRQRRSTHSTSTTSTTNEFDERLCTLRAIAALRGDERTIQKLNLLRYTEDVDTNEG